MCLIDINVVSCNLFQLKVMGIILSLCSSISTASWIALCDLRDSLSFTNTAKNCTQRTKLHYIIKNTWFKNANTFTLKNQYLEDKAEYLKKCDL